MLDSDDRDAMAAYIAAAERYFQELEHPQRLFAKPYVPPQDAAYNVARLGVLLHHLDHQRPHTVLDFGAGMGWLSSVLLHAGCRVVALDVSPTALRLGAEAIARAHAPETRERVRYLSYDGFRFPLDDASVDRIACYDALHHVPNKRTVLREMFRVLRPGGRVCFAEPGPGHATSAVAIQEADAYGVLEDEVDAPALCALAASVGFATSYVVPLPWLDDNALTPAQFAALRSGDRRQALTWSGNDALIVLDKARVSARDSRSPGRLRADLTVVHCPDQVDPGQVFTVELDVANGGDTTWLALSPDTAGDHFDYAATFLAGAGPRRRDPAEQSVSTYRRYLDAHGLDGWVTIGAQLWPTSRGAVVDRDFGRGFLDADLHPGQRARVALTLRAPEETGVFRLAFDPVVELVTWFGARGSSPAHAYVRVGSSQATPDSRAPGRLTASIAVNAAEGPAVLVSLTNTGDTLWLAQPLPDGGWVRLGVQTLAADGRLLDREWRRIPLPRDVPPGDSVTLPVDLGDAPSPATHLRLDLVSELRCWFADVGSQTVTLTCAR